MSEVSLKYDTTYYLNGTSAPLWNSTPHNLMQLWHITKSKMKAFLRWSLTIQLLNYRFVGLLLTALSFILHDVMEVEPSSICNLLDL
jgi:hypothetical protein